MRPAPKIAWYEIEDPFKNNTVEPPTIHRIFDGLATDEPNEDRESMELNIKNGIITPSGILPVDSNWNPFEGYYAHTNFLITHHAESIIITIPGVETYKCLSPYRFRISFAKLFDKEAVQRNMLSKLVVYFNSLDKIFGN